MKNNELDILVYLEDGNVIKYSVKGIQKAIEHVFAILDKGWRSKTPDGSKMEYYSPEETLKVVIDLSASEIYEDPSKIEILKSHHEVVVVLKDQTIIKFNILFENNVREFAYSVLSKGFMFTNEQGNIEARPKHQIRKIWWDLNDKNKDLLISKYGG